MFLRFFALLNMSFGEENINDMYLKFSKGYLDYSLPVMKCF